MRWAEIRSKGLVVLNLLRIEKELKIIGFDFDGRLL